MLGMKEGSKAVSWKPVKNALENHRVTEATEEFPKKAGKVRI